MAVKAKMRKKRWVKILASPHFNEREIGESLVYDSQDLLGRTASTSMMALTGEMKKQNILVTFEVDSIKDDKAHTHIKKYTMNPSSIRRAVRKGRDKIDMSFICKTADNKKIRVKPFMQTRKSTGGAKKSAIRKLTEEIIKEIAGNTRYADFIKEILMFKIQKEVRNKVAKIYPLKSCDIRVMELLKEKEHGAKKEIVMEEVGQSEPEVAEKSESKEEVKPKKETEKAEE